MRCTLPRFGSGSLSDSSNRVSITARIASNASRVAFVMCSTTSGRNWPSTVAAVQIGHSGTGHPAGEACDSSCAGVGDRLSGSATGFLSLLLGASPGGGGRRSKSNLQPVVDE